MACLFLSQRPEQERTQVTHDSSAGTDAAGSGPAAPDDGYTGEHGRLRRSIRLQLAAFVLITLLGVSYVSANYVGLTQGLFGGGGCTVRVDLPDSGGIFTNAEVTYRGVTVGHVAGLRLIEQGVQAELKLADCGAAKIPASTGAVVADRSVVGEQYVNLVPPNGNGPYLRGGEVIPVERTSVPISTQVLLTNLNDLVTSIDVSSLRTTVQELGKAFNQRGQALGTLLDSTSNLLSAAEQNLPQTVALIRSSSTVLGTQLELGDPLKVFTANLNLLSQQLRASDGDIRRLLDNGPGQLAVVRGFVDDNRTDLGLVLSNLSTTGQQLVRRLDGVEQILELYPQMAAGGYTVTYDGISHLGMVVNFNDPPDCGDPRKGGEGYDGTQRRGPNDLSPRAPNVAARCTAPPSSGTSVRGSANVPDAPPIATQGGGVAYPRVSTDNTLRVGNAPQQAAVLADRSWVGILTAALN